MRCGRIQLNLFSGNLVFQNCAIFNVSTIFEKVNHDEEEQKRFHPRGIACSHSHHRRFSWIAVASGSSSSRGCETNAVHQQSETTWFVIAHLPGNLQKVSTWTNDALLWQLCREYDERMLDWSRFRSCACVTLSRIGERLQPS